MQKSELSANQKKALAALLAHPSIAAAAAAAVERPETPSLAALRDALT